MIFLKGKAQILLRILSMAVFLLPITGIQAMASFLSADSSVIHFSSSDSIREGKHLFFRNIQIGDTLRSCASCHYTEPQDTFHWNPSAFDISMKFRDKSVADLEEALFYPLSDKAFEAHQDPGLEPAQIAMIKVYMDNLSTNEPPGYPANFMRMIIFCIILAVFLYLATDTYTIRLIRNKLLKRFLMLVVSIFIMIMIYQEAIALGLQKGYEPDQPVRFSHEVHCVQNGIDCLYCHMPARTGKSAGFPATGICMNCHAVILEGSRSGFFEISKLSDHHTNRIPVPWIRVSNLPDHVYFHHALHYVSGGVECRECHGSLQESHRAGQETELSMGWCLDCHATRKSNSFDGEYYRDQYMELRKEMQFPRDSVLVRDLGGWDCVQCHF